MTFPISDWELLGTFELESAECGDAGEPFIRFDRQGLISSAELTLIVPWSGYKKWSNVISLCSCVLLTTFNFIKKKIYLETALIGH